REQAFTLDRLKHLSEFLARLVRFEIVWHAHADNRQARVQQSFEGRGLVGRLNPYFDLGEGGFVFRRQVISQRSIAKKIFRLAHERLGVRDGGSASTPLPAIHVTKRDKTLHDQEQPKRGLRGVPGPFGKARCLEPKEVTKPDEQKASR